MRITYLHQYFVTPAGNGGTRSYEMARRMIDAGHDVTVVTSSALLTTAEREQIGSDGLLTVDGIKCHVVHVPYSNSMAFSRRIRAFVDFAIRSSLVAVRTKSDVIFATSTPLTIAIPAILAKLTRRVPMVFEVRDLWPELPIAMGALKNPLARKVALALEWVAYRSASHVVALSPGMAAGVTSRGVPEEQVTVVPNACDIDRFSRPESGSRGFLDELLGFSPSGPMIVYAGTFGPINGVDYLIELAATVKEKAPDIHFLIVGKGAMEENLVARARELEVLDRTVHVRPPVPKEDMPSLLAEATVATSLFIDIPEMRNNSANKFFDALAAGRPIVINYGGWHHDLVKESGAGLSLRGLPLEVAAEKLIDLVESPDELAAARAAATNLAMQFDRDRLSEKVIQIIEQV